MKLPDNDLDKHRRSPAYQAENKAIALPAPLREGFPLLPIIRQKTTLSLGRNSYDRSFYPSYREARSPQQAAALFGSHL